ncbi:MAG: hypothetical protein KAX51_02780, partial [Chromatiaceae bacterium]|nr:hypothetical protein [Chromatiaceae bacterium]
STSRRIGRKWLIDSGPQVCSAYSTGRLRRPTPGKSDRLLEDCWSTNGVFLLTGQGKALRAKAGQAQPLAPGARFYLATPAISFEVNYQ